MRHYEVTFIVDSVLSSDEINAAAKVYQDMIVDEGAEIVHVNEMGLRQLAYPIKKRTTGIYYSVEYKIGSGELISKIDLAMRRDERIMRSLVVRLDKYGVKYNDDKRNGKIGKAKRTVDKQKAADAKKKAASTSYNKKVDRKSAPATVSKPAVAKVTAPVAAPATETVVASKEEE